MSSPSPPASPDALAATMGFASFGATTEKKSNKRRRLDEGTSVAPHAPGTGANEVPVRVRQTAAVENQPKPKTQADLAKGGLAAFLGYGKDLPVPTAPETVERKAEGQVRAAEPVREERVVGEGRREPKTTATAGLNDYRYGVKTANGDIAYFMPSFLEDPWKDLV
ncbi:hypothetical protein ANO11243_046610 [Dothideomycetidae sp. 11243]|nr:hypothetical protein ANO11243_046610 [fungal sp. No.11243]